MWRLQQMQEVLDVMKIDGRKDKENSQKMNLIHIDDLKCPELALYASTSEAGLLHRFEPAEGVFIAESPKVIERALADGYEPISFLLEEKDERMYWARWCRICTFCICAIFDDTASSYPCLYYCGSSNCNWSGEE